MRSRALVTLGPLVALGLLALLGPGSLHEAAAADKATLACIQSAEEGETARKAGQLLHARELFAQCAARECPKLLRHDCSSWLEEADGQVPSIVLGAHDAQGHDVVDARASVDGTVVRERLDGNAIALDPGTHVVHFERVGVPAVDVQVVLRAGEKNRPILATLAPPAPPEPPSPPPTHAVVPVEPPPPPAPSPHVPAGAWILGGVALVGFGAFGYFGVTGMNDASTLRGTCAPGCTDGQVQSVRHKLIAADVGLGVGALSLVGAIVIAATGLSHGKSNAAGWNLVVTPTIGAGGSAAILIHF